jgi:hypothetical protein
MRLAFSASLHAPLEFNGAPATLNFWSSEKDAFPEEAVELLVEIARIIAGE